MSGYVIGAVYKASKQHIDNARCNDVTFKNADGTFKVAGLSPDGGAWSHDAQYEGHFQPEIEGVGVYCAMSSEVDDDELIALPDNGQEGVTDE